MEPWMSWTLFGALLAGAYFYYASQNKPQATKARSASVSSSTQASTKPARKREENKAKSKPQAALSSGIEAVTQAVNGESSTSGAESSKKGRKGAKKQQANPLAAPITAAKAAVTGTSFQEDDQETIDKAWAQNLAALKKGTSLAPPSRTDSRNRTVKQSSANFSSASSNAADADDDLTPARSPTLAAGGVADMLEPTSSAPSVLRLTESAKPTQPKQQRQQAAAETAESKKQRQNRQKVEERRLQREAEEKERQVLLENQRRTAREARGEPARNGLQSSKPPAASEWAVRAAARATQPPTESVSNGKTTNGGLLDTFSEEDQMSMAKKLSEDESGWNTVPKGKKQKKKASEFGESNDSETASAPVAVPAPTPESAPVPASKSVESRSNGFPSSFDTSAYDTGSHPEDSQWSA